MMPAPTFRLSMMGADMIPLAKKAEKAKELGRDGKETKKYIRKAPSKTPEQLEEERHATEQLARECEFRRRASIHDGEEFLKDFLNCHFEEHLDQIRITCDLTLEGIKMIGNEEDQKLGVRQCRRLFNAPVLSDRIGHLLWCELRQGDTLDHNHQRPSNGEAERRSASVDEAPEQRRASELEIIREGSVDIEEPDSVSPTCGIQRCWTGMPHDNYGWNPDYFAPSKTETSDPTAPASPASEPDMTHQCERVKSAPDKLHLPKKRVDCLMEGIRKCTAVGAGYLAASLASGYCL